MFENYSSKDVTGFPVAGTIDIVDQETLTVESLGSFLDEAGATVRHHHSGPEDIMKALNNPPHLIIMELCMPTPDEGIQIAREISLKAPETARLILTRETDPNVIKQVRQAGVNGVLYKTNCRLNDILSAVHALISQCESGGNGEKRIPISEALKVLNAHQDKITTVNEWADFMGYKKSTFWRLYTSHYKTAPRNTLNRVKKERFWKLLQANPGIPTQELAEKLGYANSEYIYQVARALFGASFSELRKGVAGKTKNETNP